MGSFSIWHWLVVLLLILFYVVPMAIIIGRTGHSRWWVIALCLPILNVIGLWVLALVRWPAVGTLPPKLN